MSPWSLGPVADELRERREAIVRDHTRSENEHDFAHTVATFHAPRYEVLPTGEVHDGAERVAAFVWETHAAFPRFEIETHALYHAPGGVAVEATFRGEHAGTWRGLPATGRAVEYRLSNVFVFDGERLVCERLNFDMLTILRQLGIARDPTSLGGRVATLLNHPLVAGAALARSWRARRGS